LPVSVIAAEKKKLYQGYRAAKGAAQKTSRAYLAI